MSQHFFISIKDIQRLRGITYKSAWRYLKKIKSELKPESPNAEITVTEYANYVQVSEIAIRRHLQN